MPTGYTSILLEKENVTFREFALRCARAFGALVHMRDDDLNAEIPETINPYSYHTEALARAQSDLKRWEGMSTEARTELATAELARQIRCYKESEQESEQHNTTFENMKAQVNNWTPPTPEHRGLKDFMLEQLTASQSGNGLYWITRTEELNNTTPEQWCAEHDAFLRHQVIYHIEEQRKEEERAASRNNWLKQLRDSL